jgi:hypothetical protein
MKKIKKDKFQKQLEKYCPQITNLLDVHRERNLNVCDTTLIPDYFDCEATSEAASKIEDIINLLLHE